MTTLGLAQPVFTDVTASAGIDFLHINGEKTSKKYLFEAKGGGLGFFDYDNDGWLDVFVVQGSTVERLKNGSHPHSSLYRNRGDGSFEDATLKAEITSPGWGMGVTFGDYDNDGFVDIYVTQLTANLLYRNNGDGTFSDRAQTAGVADSRWSSSATFGDYDQDGDLDLYVCNYVEMSFADLPEPGSQTYCKYRGKPEICGPMGLKAAANALYRNNGDGTFVDVTSETGIDETNYYYSLGAVWADLDNDRDLDLLVSNDSTPNLLFVNRGDGTFEERGFLSGLAASADGGFQASMGVDAADFDNDGLLDVFMTHFANDYSTLYHNEGDLLFEDVTSKAKLLQPGWLMVSWGTRFVDLDHDGWKDLFHANGHVYPFLLDVGWSEKYAQPSSLYINQRDGTFKDVRLQAGSGVQTPKTSRGVAFGDYDNDGDVDLLIANLNDSPQLLRNDLESRNHWVMFRTRGRISNRDGIGARIRITAGNLKQIWEIKRSVGIYSASDPRAHFGLGHSLQIDQVEVDWPSGKVQEFRDVRSDRHYVIDESEGIRPEFSSSVSEAQMQPHRPSPQH